MEQPDIHASKSPVSRRLFLGGITAGGAVLALANGADRADAAPPAATVLHNEMSQDAWEAYLGKQDLVWTETPIDFYQAPFMGNGGLGVAVYRLASRRRLKFEIGDNRVRDHQPNGDVRFGTARLPVGHFILETVGDVIEVDLRLSLWNAELTGTVYTTTGTLQLSAFVHATENVLVVSLTPDAGESSVGWNFIPRAAKSTVLAYEPRSGLLVNPEPRLEQDAEGGLCDQPLAAGGGHATAWRVVTVEGTRHLVASIAASFPEATAAQTATATAQAGVQRSIDRLRTEHRKWWNSYYPNSFVSVPDARLQSFYWIQLYKVACVTRRDRPVISTMGQWVEQTPWPAIWWNLNVQLSYWLLNPTGHAELDSLTRTLDEDREALGHNVPAGYRHDSYAINRASQDDLVTSPVGVPGVGTPEVGNLTWALHNVWLTYRHSMDDDLLRHVLYPLLTRSVNYYLHFLYEGDDGRLHLPRTLSPEYDGSVDCNYDLALIRWGCKTLLAATDRLGVEDPLRARWQDVHDRLVDPPQGTDGLWIGAERQLTSSHRHYSHLLWFYPLYLLDPTVPANRDLLERSLAHWVSFTGALQGYTFTGAASMSASMGKGKDALDYLNTLLDRYIQPNTMYRESGPVLETPLSGAQVMHDMLMQSWGETVRVFPAVPPSWAEAQIHDLRAEGAFLVSARRAGGRTNYVRVKSLAGEPLTLAHSIEGPVSVHRVMVTPGGNSYSTDPVRWTTVGDGTISIELAAGDDVIVVPAGGTKDLTVAPVSAATASKPWGLQAVLPRPEGVVVPVDLTALFNNDGIATAANPTDGSFDTAGYTYPAAELPSSGHFRNAGTTFAFPGSADGAKNNITSNGTVINVPPGRARRLRILGASTGGNAAADAVATYADGTTETIRISLTDWGKQPAFGEAVAILTTHRLGRTGPQNLQVRIFHQLVEVDSTRELVSLKLPTLGWPVLHLFALSLERPA